MATYGDLSVPFDDDLGIEIEDDLPRGPRSGSLPRHITTAIAVLFAVGIAAAAAYMAYNVGQARSTPTTTQGVNVDQAVAQARAAGVAAGQKAGYAQGFNAGVAKGTNAASLKSFNRGFARGKKRGYAQGVRDGRRRGFSDGVDSVGQRYQQAIADLNASLDQAKKDVKAANKKADKAKQAKSQPPPDG
jgi:hypothetical protein